jgi:hypothetical protein
MKFPLLKTLRTSKLQLNLNYLNSNQRKKRNLSTLSRCPRNAVIYLFNSKLTSVTFMVTRPPIDPVRLVREICLETLAGNKRTRWAQRFTPIQLTGYANLTDLNFLAEKVIGPVFHAENVSPIRVSPIILCLNVSMQFVLTHETITRWLGIM